MTPLKKTRFTIPFLLFIFMIFLLWKSLSLQPSIIPSPFINKPAPYFELPTLYNTSHTVSNKDFLGRITLLNIWATWCYACAIEHDFLMQLSDNEDITIMGLNYKDDSALAKKWLEHHGNPYRLIAVDKTGETAIDWGVYGTPETFLIDPRGVVRLKQIGPITSQIWESKIKPLISEIRNETR